MKKALVFFALLGVMAVLIIGCDQQKALDQILQNPEMKAYMMTKMMQDTSVKAEITNELLADSAWVAEIVNRMGEQMTDRQMMLNTLLSHEGMGEIMLEKMAEDPALKSKMAEIGKRR
jgi:non-ribosomal peptide synthetase component E (peptide arylation enzyme)